MLAQKLRPQNLDEVIGNQHIKDALDTFFREYKSTGAFPHTLLLEGGVGQGKTTTARIIAKELGSESPLEHDCGANGDINTIRGIIEEAGYTSLFSNVNVIILDEIHKLSQAAQNTLLKITEDTPKNTYFILCTSESKSIIPALRSRCVSLTVHPAKLEDIREAYKKARNVMGDLELEGGKEAWESVVRVSEGSLRKVYMILESLYAAAKKSASGKQVTQDTLESLLGISLLDELNENSPLPKAFISRNQIEALKALEVAKKEKQPYGTLVGLYNYLKKVQSNNPKKERQELLKDISYLLMNPDKSNNWYALEWLIFSHT